MENRILMTFENRWQAPAAVKGRNSFLGSCTKCFNNSFEVSWTFKSFNVFAQNWCFERYFKAFRKKHFTELFLENFPCNYQSFSQNFDWNTQTIFAKAFFVAFFKAFPKKAFSRDFLDEFMNLVFFNFFGSLSFFLIETKLRALFSKSFL